MSENTVTGAGTAQEANPSAESPTTTPPDGVIPYPSPPDTGAGEAIGPSAGTGQQSEPQRTPEQEVAHWKEMARKNEARAKANADKASQFDAYQQAQMTELEKANQRAELAEKAVAESRAESLRLAAVARHDLSVEFSDLLGSGSEAEINERAERIARLVNARVEATLNARNGMNGNGNGQPQRQSGQRPVESLRPGSAPSTSSSGPESPDAMFRRLIGRG